jgi:CrcB protein
MYVGLSTTLITETQRMALGTGVMGGFTTYSSFNYELLQFFRDRAFFLFGVYLAATLLGCFVAGWLGLAAARWAVDR